MQVNNLQDILVNSKNSFAESTAFQMKDGQGYRKLSFVDVYASVLKLSTYLAAQGIRSGDRVAILSENRPEWGIAYFAISYIGAVSVPLDALLSSDELNYILNDSGTKFILISGELNKKHKFSQKTYLLEDIQSLSDINDVRAKVDENELASIVYTSGTTGNPKGVMLSHKNLASNVTSVALMFSISPKDNFLSVLPMHHTFESTCGLLCPFYLGATVTYAESLKSYNLLKNMQETKVTIMCGVPLLYNLFFDGIMREVEEKGKIAKYLFAFLLLLSKTVPVKNFRKHLFGMIHKKLGGNINFWVSGGAAIDPDVLRGFDLFGITILQGYGLTESSPILTCNNIANNRLGAAGRPIPGVEVRLTEDGEIVARGPNIMMGYFGRDDLTAEVIKENWLYTGDKGSIDKAGFLFITGRIKDVIVTGAGVNVSPDELESRICKIKGIKEVCVIGVKIQSGIHKGMEEVVAIIVPQYDYFTKHSKLKTEEDIEMFLHGEIQKLNQGLAAYKRISKTKIRSIELPKTSTKKVKRFQVRREMGL